MKFDGIFKELCKRGKSNQTMTKDYKCRFQTKNSYYRILIPFKEEDIHHDPLIKIYHDVLYDDEIIKIKSISQDNVSNSFAFIAIHKILKSSETFLVTQKKIII